MKSLKWQTKIGLVVLATVMLAGTAYAITFVRTFQGTVQLTDYQGFYDSQYEDYTGPATVQIQEITMKPGDAFPWHYHEGQSYAILTEGTLTEEDGCGKPQIFHAGAAFVEPPGFVHRVINNGPGNVTLYWATVYPSKAGPLVTTQPDGSPVKPPPCS